jgi:MFS family permease
MSTPAREPQTPDPRRWITLGVLVGTVVLVAMDLTVLNVSIPAILRDLETTVPSLGWVIAGYSLTFASLLIVGGRLGDLFGHRRIFVIGALVFGTGSLLAALSPGIGFLILGKAVIEGVGAALMVPATLALLAARSRATSDRPPSPPGARPPARQWRSAPSSGASSPPTTRGAGASP